MKMKASGRSSYLDGTYYSYLNEYDPYNDDYEACELGEVKEIVPDYLLLPVHCQRSWSRCVVIQNSIGGLR